MISMSGMATTNADLPLSYLAGYCRNFSTQSDKKMYFKEWSICYDLTALFNELLPPDKTIHLDLYYQQLMRLKQEVEKKCPELINRKDVVFHHDNTRPHAFLVTQ
ncbi:hypothetical protein EVAR_40138_1 [Eumeta japonica]|uniref:Mariner Mos1 transposase n=1 Tax=Eumeta variegata TaxID=151549 RepID=A0A4C1WAQ1_EUMVA|nr:hypothetical protein EVAR_40138_1 [Eumeta japonica]